ncbi:abscission/NoCut checkpoint regulator isoform X2 [Plodia interpunctella]|nr:abscission/NoCut checkpoint regulator isoform X2 [Plodia interpunctella]XP_053613774.1 abscission/NoCut checkpoint regulator isoform X2 [Plodia interpunctella]XP_053613775.1 abscission/NoCut checkpoint regulator isoform X2 [Plodia interpunctella]
MIYVEKLKAEAKVCMKCAKTTNAPKIVEPPDAYYKRIGLNRNDVHCDNGGTSSQDQEIHARLLKLKQDTTPKMTQEEEIAIRLKNIKGEVPSTSDAELQQRLANLRGVPVNTLQSKNICPIVPETRTEQEQANDLLKQYMAQAQIDGQYKDEFDALVSDMEMRVQKLKDSSLATKTKNDPAKEASDSEDEDEIIKKIVEKIKIESSREDNQVSPKENDELPFCEICNEDAKMRCLGCHYLFCKRCFLEHKDDDDGCDRYELYKPPKNQ